MLAIYETVNRRLTRADEIEEGTWICLTAPSQEEIREVAATLDIEPADVQAALDPDNPKNPAKPRLSGAYGAGKRGKNQL